MSLVVYGHCRAVQNDGEAVPILDNRHNPVGELVELGSVSRQGVGLQVELFTDNWDAPLVDALVTKVAGDFLDAREIWLGKDASVDAGL